MNPSIALIHNSRRCSYRNGEREGHTLLYHRNAFPEDAIAPVSFMWKYALKQAEETQTEEMDVDGRQDRLFDSATSLWLWYHPAVRDELYDDLVTDIASFRKNN